MVETPKTRVLRVTQLDVAQCDQSLFNIIYSQLKSSFHKNESWEKFFNLCEPELNAILRYVLWKLSIKATGVTVGQRLFSTEYTHLGKTLSSKRKLLIGVVAILLPWLKSRQATISRLINILCNLLSVEHGAYYVDELYKHSDRVLKLLSLINFLVFLRYGQRAGLTERVLQVDHVFQGKPSPRYIDYAYTRKELIWEHTCQTFICLLPFINTTRIQTFFLKVCKYFAQGHDGVETERFLCQICEMKATNPYSSVCAHVFCYYCIQSNLETDSNYKCPTCGVSIEELGPVVVTI